MKGRETKAPPKADLLVCFPSRAHHLTLMPKPICSPGRPPEPNKRHHNHHHHQNNHYLKKSSTTRSCGQASPLLWAKTKSMGSEIAEPTSPKVTCAGQIKIRHKTTACRSWESVMEKIEKIHNHNETKQNQKQKKKKNKKKKKNYSHNWAHYSLSFKKEAMQFLTCFRGMRFNLRCFGAFTEANITTEEEEEEDEEEDETTGTVFSKLLMALQEKDMEEARNEGSSEEAEEHNVPPPNALLLMRCRSAPVRSLFVENEERKKGEQGKEGKVKEKAKANSKAKSLKSLMEENRKKENLLVMRCDSDFYKISSSVTAQEAWIVGGGSWNN